MVEVVESSNISSEVESFLTQHFQSRNYNVLELAGDASTRRYFRVIHQEQPYVLMVWEPFKDDDNYPFLSVLRYFSSKNIPVPRVEAKSPEKGLVLLEDLGDLTLERKFWENHNEELVLPYYENVLKELEKIHFSTSKEDNVNCTAFNISFDVEKLLWEMNYGYKHLLKIFCKIKLSDKDLSNLKKIFLEVCQTLADEPQVICHRDFHSRNVMIKLGRIRIIDFQDARLGPVAYDLVSLLKDSYVNLSESSHNTLYNFYHGITSENGSYRESRAKFDEIYEIQTIQRCFKACGSFSSFFNMREDRRYLKHISSTLLHVRKSLSLFPKYQLFSSILEDNGLFEKKFEEV